MPYRIAYAWNRSKRAYVLYTRLEYTNRQGRKVICDKGMTSDGATGAFDINSKSWWIHDKICRVGVWEDGTPVTKLEAALVLYDILKEEGRYIRARTWFIMTYLFGCKKAKR